MNYEQFERVVRRLYEEKRVQDQIVSEIPNYMYEVVADNPYTNSVAETKDFLQDELFGDMAEDVYWFLYECNERCDKIWAVEKEYTIKHDDIETYFDYARKELFGEK
jgi:histone H3/H4